jgi:thiol-disulfide isomerase/thioredoxin
LHGRARRRAALSLISGALFLAGAKAAAAPRLEDFTASTWAQWQKDLPRPAVVVFSTTYCPSCPEVFADLAQSVRKAGAGTPMIAVVMNADGLSELSHLAHYWHADRIFVFRGQEAALRFSVNPQWRGVTPYVALFGQEGPPRLVAGRPTAEQLAAVSALR